jgi:SAM-dependent methyltransferase
MAYLAKRSNGRVLEVGCGYGLPARILKDVCEEIVGIDPDLNAVAVARELFPEIPIKPLTLEEYFAEYPEERFDVIVSAFTPLEATIPKILQRCNVYIRVGYRPKNFSEVISVRDRWSSRSLRFDTRAWGEVVAGFDLTYFRWLVHIDFPRWLRRTYRKWGFPSF